MTHLPNKGYQEWDELPLFDEDREVRLRDVPVQVKRLCHVTHNQQASKIDQGDRFIFKPNKKIGKAGYNYDGSPVGETFVICEPTDQPPTNDTKYRYIDPNDPDNRVFPGYYIWWSIDRERYPKPPPGCRYSHFFTSSSCYGNVKFSGYIRQLLQCYQKAYNNINPLPRVQFRCGGTLRYNYEICKVVIVCTEIHYPQPQDEFPLMWEDHDIKYRDGRITFVKPLDVVIRNIISKKNDKFYSWDTYAFAFYFPDDTYKLLCPTSELFERSEVRHYKCHVSQPDPKNGNKFTCPNLLHTRDDSESDEEEQSSHKKPKKQKVEDHD